MGTFYIKQGRNIQLEGAAKTEIVKLPIPARVAILPQDFRGIKPRLEVEVGNLVKAGTPVLVDRTHPEIKIVSPASGKVMAINRGDKRLLLEIVIEPDGRQEAIHLRKFSHEEIKNLSRQQIIEHLLEGGVWPFIRQRPFSKIAHPQDTPQAIFIQAMNTEPLAPDVDFILKDKEAEFQTGLDILRQLTKGKVYLCFDLNAKSKALLEAKNVEKHTFAGPHPAGNVSTHIHYLNPIRQRNDIVWYLGAQEVLRAAALFLYGAFSPERYVAITGEGAEKRVYAQTIIGTAINNLFEGKLKSDMRYISGSILNGKNSGRNGYLSFYDTQVTVIPEGGRRHFLGWLTPGFKQNTFSKTFVSSFLPEREVAVDTDTHGSDRAIVLNDIYDQYVALDIMTFFLLRAVIAGDIEEAEKLGILECDEEDFALCSFACPSKTDVGGIIRAGLDLIEREG